MHGRVSYEPPHRGALAVAEGGGNEIGFVEESAYAERNSALDPSNLFRLLLRWRWLFLGILAATVTIATLWAALQTPLYRASATLELNPNPREIVAREGAGRETTQTDRDFLALQVGLIKSRYLAERVARQLNLARNSAFLGHEAAEPAQEEALAKLMRNLTVNGTNSDRIVEIRYVHEDPQVAAKVANAYAEQAVEASFDRALASTEASRQFLQRQLQATRQKLEESERALIGYARSANIVNVTAGENGASNADSAGGTLLASSLVALNNQLAEAQNARIVAQERYAQAGASAGAAVQADPTVQALEQQRAQLQAEYEQSASKYLPDHPTVAAMRARLDRLASEISQARGRTASATSSQLRAEAAAAANREGSLRARIRQLEAQLLDLNDRGVQYTILKRAVDANRSLYNALLTRLGEENTSATRTSNIALIDSAQTPGGPFSPNLPRAMLLGLVGGLIFGAVGCAVVDRWRDTINGPDDLMLLGLPVLGVIPRAPSREELEDVLSDPHSAVSEAYHSVRAALQFTGKNGLPKSILFTSSRANEGKTSSVIALSADLSGIGLKVVVVDADLRKPSLRGHKTEGGLSGILGGTTLVENELRAANASGLHLIHAGPVPTDPTVLLANRAFENLIRELEQQFDVVIVDGPPVMGLADAVLLSGATETTLVVVESGSTRRSALRTALGRLRGAGGTVAGAILTKFDQKSHAYGYGYGYEYSYGGQEPGRLRSLIGSNVPSTDPA